MHPAVLIVMLAGIVTVHSGPTTLTISCESGTCESGNLMTITPDTNFDAHGSAIVSFTSNTGTPPTCSTGCTACSTSPTSIVCALTVQNGIATSWKVAVETGESVATTFVYATNPFVEQAQGGGCTVTSNAGGGVAGGFTNGQGCKTGTVLTIIGAGFDFRTPENNDISFRVPYQTAGSYITNEHLGIYCANEGAGLTVTTVSGADAILCDLIVPPATINAATIAEVYVVVAGSIQKNDFTAGNTDLPFPIGAELQLMFDLTKTYTVTPTESPSSTVTSSPTASPTPTTTETVTGTATSTPTASPTLTPTETSSRSSTPTGTATNTPTSTESDTRSSTSTGTSSSTATESYSRTWSNTGTASSTSTTTETGTRSGTPSPTQTGTSTNSPTPTPTETGTRSPTSTFSATPTPTETSTSTRSSTNTRTETDTQSTTITTIPTHTPSATQTNSRTWSTTATGTTTDTVTYTETTVPHWSDNVTTSFNMAPDDWDIRTAENAYRFQKAAADYLALRGYENIQILYTDAGRTSRGHPDFSRCVVTWRIIDNGYGVLSESSYNIALEVTTDQILRRVLLNATGFETALIAGGLDVITDSTKPQPDPEPPRCRTCDTLDSAVEDLTGAKRKCTFTVNGEAMQAFVFPEYDLDQDCNGEKVIGAPDEVA